VTHEPGRRVSEDAPTSREDVARSLNSIADKARDLDDIAERLLQPGLGRNELGELLIAFQLTSEQIRVASDLLGEKLFEIGDRLREVEVAETDD
jgi:hypothetical protein